MEQAVIHGPPVPFADDAAHPAAKGRRVMRWAVGIASGCAALAACIAGLIVFGIGLPSAEPPTPTHVMNLRDGSVVKIGRAHV